LHVRVDRIAALEIVAARLKILEEAEPAVPPPPFGRRRIEMLIRSIPDDAAHAVLGVAREPRGDRLEERRLEANVVVDERDEIALGAVDAGVALNGRAAA